MKIEKIELSPSNLRFTSVFPIIRDEEISPQSGDKIFHDIAETIEIQEIVKRQHDVEEILPFAIFFKHTIC